MDNNNIYRFLVSGKTKPKKGSKKSNINCDEVGENLARLVRYRDMWDRLEPFRRKRKRLRNYVFGDQWKDKVKVDGKWITEEENIENQGKAPLKNNMMRAMIKAVLGTFHQNRTSAECVSRTREKQKLGEMMTVAVQYAGQINEVELLDARSLEELCISGMTAQCVRYKYLRKKQAFDVYIENVNVTRCFWNIDNADIRANDITTFGLIEDLDIDEVYSRFAKSADDVEKIRKIYSTTNKDALYSHYGLDKERYDNVNFYTPDEFNKCRVYQVWELESKPRLLVWDKSKGTTKLYELEDKAKIEAQTNKRVEQLVAQGFDEEVAREQLGNEIHYYVDRFYYVRYLTPTGESLFEGVTPYTHKDMPFELCFYPLIDGEVHSLAEDMLDQQRYINRLITLADFIIGSSAKGVLIFPEDALGDMTKEEVLEEYQSYNGVIFAKIRNGGAMPQQLSLNATNVGIYDLLNLQIKLMQETTGIHPALMGQQAKSGTPSSLYLQETQNSQANIVDMLHTFDQFRKRRDTKIMKVIEQYYTEEKYINLAGHDYEEEAYYYNPEKIRNAEIDLVMQESNISTVYRNQLNEFIMASMSSGGLDIKSALKLSGMPFADRILKQLEGTEQEQQQAMMAMQQQGNPQAQQLLQQAIMGGGKQ